MKVVEIAIYPRYYEEGRKHKIKDKVLFKGTDFALAVVEIAIEKYAKLGAKG